MSLALWNKVCETDPRYTKKFTKSGGFSGTAINATYQIMRATELWGPIGGKWGYEIQNEEFVPGAEGDILHKVTIQFYYPCEECEMFSTATFPCFGQTIFVGKNSRGPFTDEDAPKKSLTDAVSKALSLIGFSADIHLGLFDDNKYVSTLENKYKSEPGVLETADPKYAQMLSNATTVEELGKVWKTLPTAQRKLLQQAKDDLKQRLLSAQTNGTQLDEAA